MGGKNMLFEDKTLGLTHPFYHNRGVGIAYNEEVRTDNDFSGSRKWRSDRWTWTNSTNLQIVRRHSVGHLIGHLINLHVHHPHHHVRIISKSILNRKSHISKIGSKVQLLIDSHGFYSVS